MLTADRIHMGPDPTFSDMDEMDNLLMMVQQYSEEHLAEAERHMHRIDGHSFPEPPLPIDGGLGRTFV